MEAVAKTREGADFITYQAQDDDRLSGWSWYCMHCPDVDGWRWNRADARSDARKHGTECPTRPTP